MLKSVLTIGLFAMLPFTFVHADEYGASLFGAHNSSNLFGGTTYRNNTGGIVGYSSTLNGITTYQNSDGRIVGGASTVNGITTYRQYDGLGLPKKRCASLVCP